MGYQCLIVECRVKTGQEWQILHCGRFSVANAWRCDLSFYTPKENLITR